MIGVQGRASVPHSSFPLFIFCVAFSRVCAVGRWKIVTAASVSVRHICLWTASLESRSSLGLGVILSTAGEEISVMGLFIYGVLQKTHVEERVCITLPVYPVC